MIGFLKFALIGTVLLGVANGASVATASAKGSNCTVQDGYAALMCLVVSNSNIVIIIRAQFLIVSF